VRRAGINAIRISPNVFTTHEEVDRLGTILDRVGREGIQS
jgi:selenocysteine lyase/cysteine desulfurase